MFSKTDELCAFRCEYKAPRLRIAMETDDFHRALVRDLRAAVEGWGIGHAIGILRARAGVVPRALYAAIMEDVTEMQNGVPYVRINMLRRLAMVVEAVFPQQTPPLIPVPLKKFGPLNNDNPDPPGDGPLATAWGALLSRVGALH